MTAAGATQVDVAVVGAGVSGVYCAWRLAMSDEYRDAYIAVYELSDRVGGPEPRTTSTPIAAIRFCLPPRARESLRTNKKR